MVSSTITREDVATQATVNPLRDFLQHLINNPQEREKLQGATPEQIVLAGKQAGYDFAQSDLEALFQRFNATGRLSVRPPQACRDSGGEWLP